MRTDLGENLPLMRKTAFVPEPRSIGVAWHFGLVAGAGLGHGKSVTHFSDAEFGLVVAQVRLMLAAQEFDEAWRVLAMFADGRFTHRLADFPAELQRAFAGLGPRRQRSYPALLDQLATLAPVFQLATIGQFTHDGRSYPIVKSTWTPPASAYETVMPVCLVAGIHGDEPDSVFGALELARRFGRSPELCRSYALTIYPCLNPVGYERMSRANGRGRDLNREFFRDSTEPEVLLMERELAAHDFLGMIGTHSDYESFGIYAYAAGALLSQRLAKPALVQASSVIPINTDSVIDGRPATLGIISQKYPNALGPLTKGTVAPFDITIETPNLFALHKRIEAHAVACETVLHEYRALAAEALNL